MIRGNCGSKTLVGGPHGLARSVICKPLKTGTCGNADFGALKTTHKIAQEVARVALRTGWVLSSSHHRASPSPVPIADNGRHHEWMDTFRPNCETMRSDIIPLRGVTGMDAPHDEKAVSLSKWDLPESRLRFLMLTSEPRAHVFSPAAWESHLPTTGAPLWPLVRLLRHEWFAREGQQRLVLGRRSIKIEMKTLFCFQHGPERRV